jgi:hypothetical protein
MRRSSRFLRRIARLLIRPRRYGLRWQLDRAHARVRELERERAELVAARVVDAREAANAVCQAAGTLPAFESKPPRASLDDTDPAIYLDRERMLKRAVAQRQHNREAYAALADLHYQQVLDMEARGEFDTPELDIHNPTWWLTVAPELQREKEKMLSERAS